MSHTHNDAGSSPPNPPVHVKTIIVSQSAVMLKWKISEVTYDPETYVVHYGIQVNSLSSLSEVVSGYSVEVTGLKEKTTYYYRVYATNSNGTTSSAINTFTTSSHSK